MGEIGNGRAVVGGFKVPTGRSARVNARFKRKISRVVRQLLEQETGSVCWRVTVTVL